MQNLFTTQSLAGLKYYVLCMTTKMAGNSHEEFTTLVANFQIYYYLFFSLRATIQECFVCTDYEFHTYFLARMVIPAYSPPDLFFHTFSDTRLFKNLGGIFPAPQFWGAAQICETEFREPIPQDRCVKLSHIVQIFFFEKIQE